MLQRKGRKKKDHGSMSKETLWAKRGQEVALLDAFPLLCLKMSVTCRGFEQSPSFYFKNSLLRKMVRLSQTEGLLVRLAAMQKLLRDKENRATR